jgi:hypothetical protein
MRVATDAATLLLRSAAVDNYACHCMGRNQRFPKPYCE